MNVSIKFDIKPDYNKGIVVIELVEVVYKNGDRWKKTNILYSRKAKIKGLFGFRSDIGYKISEIKRDLISLYQRDSGLRAYVDKECLVRSGGEYAIVDQRTSDLINRFTDK